MAKRLLKTLTNNLAFKILAVFLATILWLVVYNLDDPNKTKNFSTNVTIINADVLTNMNKCYEVMDNTNTVSFSVTAKKSYIDNLEDMNFTAVADMNNVVMDDDQQAASVPIEITSNNYNRYITVNGKTKYLRISLDELMTKRFVVTAETNGSVAKGSAIGEVSVSNPSTIKVSGPKGIVINIDKVVATIDVSDMSVSLSDNVVPIFYDKKGREIDTTRLTLSTPTVQVAAKILNTKKVPLDFNTTGTPARYYTITEIVAEPSAIEIKGPSGQLNTISSIEIPKEVLDVQGASADIETTIDVTEYLPDGVELVDSSQRTIEVAVKIEGRVTQEYTVPAENFRIEGVQEGFESEFMQKNIVVRIAGMQSDLDELDVDAIIGTVDVSNMGKGTHRVTVSFALSDKYSVAKCKTDVIIREVASGNADDAGDGGASESREENQKDPQAADDAAAEKQGDKNEKTVEQ